MKKLINILLKYDKVFIQFVKFGIVGLSNTLIYLMIYYVLIMFKTPYIIANGIGFVASVVNAYYWNIRYVFQINNKNRISKFIRVSIAYSLTFILSTFLLYFFVNILLISKYIAPFFNLIITIPLNFLLIKYWALRNINPAEEETI